MIIFTSLALLAYLLGSIPFGKLQAHRYGVDIQKIGSGNIGFRNAIRAVGLKRAWPVLVGDMVKGYFPTIVALNYLPPWQAAIIAALTVAGHVFPLWLRLRGGKGIATGLGILLALDPFLVGFALVIYVTAYATMRQSAPSSLLASWCVPILSLAGHSPYTGLYLGFAILVTWTHRGNIAQMRRAGLRAA